MFEDFRKWFWKDGDWLAPGVTWSDVEKVRPWSTLYIVPFIAIIFVIARFIFEHYVALNVCIFLGIAGQSKKAEASNGEGDSTSAVTNEKSGVRFFRKSRLYDKGAQFYKATETCWRCFIYFVLFVFGSYAVMGSDWFWTESWNRCALVNKPLAKELKWYIIAELSFYISLLMTQFSDTRRKDFLQQCVHHITTIILIAACYIIAHFNTGSVIMWLHDASDYWLEAAKLAKYAKRQPLCDRLFTIFAVLFYITRWIYFPFFVLVRYSTDNPSLTGPSYFAYPWLFFYMCFILMVLHYYWGYLIARMVYKFVVTGKLDKDERSDDEDDHESSAED